MLRQKIQLMWFTISTKGLTGFLSRAAFIADLLENFKGRAVLNIWKPYNQ